MIKVEPTSTENEVAGLRRTVRDLAALAALPAIWISSDLPRSLQNLAEVLSAAVGASAVFIRVTSPVGELVEAATRNSMRSDRRVVDELRRYLSHHLDLSAQNYPATLPSEDGKTQLRVCSSHVATQGEVRGVIIALLPPSELTNERDRLLLHTGATQIAILLRRHEIEHQRETQTRSLRATEARSELLMQLLPAGVCMCDEDGIVTFFNRRAAELMQGEPAKGESWATFCAPYVIQGADTLVAPLAATPMMLALNEGRTFRDVELLIIRPDRSEFFVSCNIDPVRTADGRSAGAINVFHDITARKRREQAAAFLAGLSQKIALAADETEIISVTLRALGKHLDVQRCYIIEPEGSGLRAVITAEWRRGDASSIRGEYHLRDFGTPEWLNAFSTRGLAVSDTHNDSLTRDFHAAYQAIDIRSYVNAPFIREDRLIAALVVAEGIKREWREDELQLLENTMARVWPLIERARVAAELFESEGRFRMIADNVAALAWTENSLGQGATWYNRRWFDYTGTTFDEMKNGGWESIHHPNHLARVKETMRRSAESGLAWEDTFPLRSKDGSYRWFLSRAVPIRDAAGQITRWFGTHTDVTELREAQVALQLHTKMLEALNRAGAALVDELDLEKIVQRVTDAGREITGAAFGAFFYNLKNERGESYMLYSLSGASREAFSKFPMPRNTAVFNPTFQGEGPVRIADVRQDTRFGKNAPFNGMPKGHLPVCSYLAVPVKSRSGEVLGGLFYGHPEPNIFGAEAEHGLVALAAQAAIAIDNARLYTALQRELKRAQQGQEANRRLALIVQSSDDAIIAKDLRGVVTSWNPAAERIFGYTTEEIVGKSILTLIPVERHHEESEILGRITRGERVDHFETVRRTKSGRLVDVSLTVSPVKADTGEIIGASKIARDITARRKAELQERTLYELVACVNRAAELPEIFDAALDAIHRCQETDRASILLTDAAGVMRFVAWHGLSDGYRATVEGHSPWQSDNPDPKPICIDDIDTVTLEPFLRAAIEGEGIRAIAFIPLVYEKRLLGKFMLYFNHAHRFTSEELRPVETVASQVAFAIVRRNSAEALEALVDERTASLQKAIEQMEEFSYSVSHDLRSPVRAMHGYAEALLADHGEKLDEEGREMLTRIQRNGARMDRLIQDLLTYTRLARQPVRLESVSLDQLVLEVIQHYPEMAPDRATIEVLGPLPEVLAHEPSLTQVISNLLANAVKFVPLGKRPHVQVGFKRMSSGHLRLWFQDNGIGIPRERQQRLFGMFERVHTEQKFEGTGIGLAIVRKAMERMNGTSGVESDGVSGSRFWIELPAASLRAHRE